MLSNRTGTKVIRTLLWLSLGVAPAAAVIACGGGTPSAVAPTGSGTGTAPMVDPSSPTTSTAVPAATGTGQKLVPTAEPSASAASNGPEPGRGPNDIRNAVLAKRAEARACFDAVAKNKPGLEGNIVVKWLIDPKGQVKDVMIDPDKTTVPDQIIGSCIIGIISKIPFPASAKHFETRASYPFNFKAAAKDDDKSGNPFDKK